MAANTFLETTRSLRLYVPELPITLAEQFIRDRYRRILDRRDWSATRKESEFQLNDSKQNGSVSFTRGTPTITGTGTTFASTDVGRQFKAGVGSPVYTITAVDVGLQQLTLDRNIGVNTSVNIPYFIMDAFVSPPVDFLRFIVVSDPLQGWRLRHWVTQDELMSIDPMRTFFGQPYVIADRMYNAAATPQFECWPYNQSARTLYYMYISRPADLVNDTDVPIWPVRSDAIVAGALADVARWPGTSTMPNPYFARPDYWKAYEMEYEDKMNEIERKDEDIYLNNVETHSWSSLPLSPMSASFIQSHVFR